MIEPSGDIHGSIHWTVYDVSGITRQQDDGLVPSGDMHGSIHC